MRELTTKALTGMREITDQEIEEVSGGTTAGDIAMSTAGGWASTVAGFAVGGLPGAALGFGLGAAIGTGYALTQH